MKTRDRSRLCSVLVAGVVCWTGAASAAAQSGRRRPRLLVTFKEGTVREERRQAAREMGLSLVDDIDGLQVAVMEAADEVAALDAERARRNPAVLAVEEDVYRDWLSQSPAADRDEILPGLEPLLIQVHRRKREAAPAAPPAGPVPWGVARVNAPTAWPSGQGAGVKVAVIDSGVDCRHPDLLCDFSAGVNIVDPGQPPMDDNGHGTHVSGTIAGRGLGGYPIGVAPKATLIPVKVLYGDGAGSLFDIIKGINWAADAGADVINLSLGGPVDSPALRRVVDKALRSGAVIVAAAGNSGPSANSVGFPAGYPGVIAVAASDYHDGVARFSSRGPIAFLAPGVNITSTIPDGGIARLSGTSMASPHVAGLAALAIERGARGPAGVRRALAAAASRVCGRAKALDSELGCPGAAEQGAGMVDAAKLAR